jgi:hypothetical protein
VPRTTSRDLVRWQKRQQEVNAMSSPSAGLGRYGKWTRDFAVLGALSSGVVPVVALTGIDPLAYYFAAVAVVIGAGVGAIIGAVGRAFIGGVGGRLPIGLLLLAGPAVGLAWGMATGSTAIGLWWWWSAGGPVPGALLREAGWYAGIAAAVQFGWFWLPYVLGRAKGRGVVRLWLLAGLSAVAVGLLLRFC